MSKLRLNLQVEPTFEVGVRRLQPLLGFETGDGITVTAVAGERAGVTLAEGRAVIYYHKKHYFFRGLGLLVQHAAKSDAFELFEDTYFEELRNLGVEEYIQIYRDAYANFTASLK